MKELYHSSDEKGGEGKEEGARLAVAGGADRGFLYFLNFFFSIFAETNCSGKEEGSGQLLLRVADRVFFLYISELLLELIVHYYQLLAIELCPLFFF